MAEHVLQARGLVAGETTLKEVRAKLHEIGLDLGMDVPQHQGV